MNKSPEDKLLFLPLGGAGEIGMNLNLYGYGPEDEESWIIVDLGITFGNGSHPGVDVIAPDPSFIEERQDQLAGLVLTHAHEDHLGAVPYLWERIGCPIIYATPFTISILSRKLSDAGLLKRATIIEIPLGGKFTIGSFNMELITLTHSIPEPNAIAIRTPVGTVLHTGDWKFDPDPVIGEPSDEEGLRALGDEGVLAIVCDSTNVFTPGHSGSEADLLKSLTDVIRGCTGRVAVACFASNVARLETISAAAKATGRDVVLAGRSLWRFQEAARENGYMSDTAEFLDEESCGFLPKDKTLIVCTGSQGEPRAALARIASGDHPRVSLGEGDTVIFSSRIIPGNEASIGRLQNQLVRRDITVLTERDHFVHVSGHPARDELTQMYQHVRPQISIPVHGEIRHMSEHAKLARECQVPCTVVVENGAVVEIKSNGKAEIIDHVPSGRLTLEGNRMVPMESELVKGRTRTMWNGSVVVTVVVDDQGELVADPQMTTFGLLDDVEDDDLQDQALDAACQAIEDIKDSANCSDKDMSELARIAVRKTFRRLLDKKPIVRVHLIRV